MKTTSCTENIAYAFNNAPRCGARTKRNNGSGGQQKNKNALKHGYTTAEIKSFRKDVSNVLRAAKAIEEFTKSK